MISISSDPLQLGLDFQRTASMEFDFRVYEKIDSQLEHILISGMFSGFFEIVVHDMPQEQAAEYIKELREFYTAGWTKIIGLS